MLSFGHTMHSIDLEIKILWGKSQATVPAPGKKGGRELAPVPGLPEGRYDCDFQIGFIPGRRKCRCVQCAHTLVGTLTKGL